MRLPDAVKMSDINTKLLYRLKYRPMKTLILVCRMSSFAGANDISGA